MTTDNTTVDWKKDSSRPRTYGFQFSPKLYAKLSRKGFWSPDGSAEIGNRKLRFASDGRANMHLVIFDSKTDNEVGTLDFSWKDFQKSQLTLSGGSQFYFKSFNLFKGTWSWIKKDSPDEQFIFRVDNPLHRSGTIEYNLKDIPAIERDILLLLGLHLQHYLNIWLMTILIVILGILTGR